VIQPQVLAGLAIVFALVAGTTGLRWGLPYIWHPDEKVELAANMIDYKSFDPDYFINPHLHLYAVRGLVWIAERVYPGHMAFGMLSIVPMTHPDDPNRPRQMAANLLARGFSVVCAVAAVWCLWRSLRRPLGEWPAAIAAAALGLSLGLMNIAHFATPEACLLLIVTLALGAFVHLGQTGRFRDAIVAGIWFGFGCSTKYTAVLLMLPLTWALLPLARSGAAGRALRLWIVTGGVGIIAFFAATPYAVLHWHAFLIDGLLFTWRTGAPTDSLIGVERTWAVYGQHLAGALGWPLFVFFVASCLWWTLRPASTESSQQTLSVHALWIAGFWGFLGLSPHQAMRFIIPLVPSAAVFVGWGAGQWLDRSRGAGLRRLARAGLTAILAYTAVYTMAGVYWFVNDTRYAAGAWLKWHVPPERAVTYFAIESYLPY
jgi:uncharacterized membrane protein